MGGRGRTEPILAPATRAGREWTLRLLRRCAVGALALALALLALNALAASAGYGAF